MAAAGQLDLLPNNGEDCIRMVNVRLLLLPLLWMGCQDGKLTIDGQLSTDPEDSQPFDTADDPTDETGTPPDQDEDGDGYLTPDDCDDEDANVHPGAEESCDGRDEDCDGEVDEDVADAPTWHIDSDGDGYGDGAVTACTAPSGAVEMDGDCDDGDSTVHPGAEEVCGDGVDNDCNDSPGDCLIAGIVSVEEATAIVYGERAEDVVGLHAEGVGDVTGDGRDDFLIGVPASDVRTTDAGLAALMSNPHGELTTADATLRLEGVDVGDSAGFALAAAGYVNDDILADMLVGAPGADGVDTNGGAVYLVLGGSTGTVSLGDSHATYLGEAHGDQAGYAVARVGDVDGDGSSEFVVGAPTASYPADEAGAVYIVSPSVGGTFNLSTADVRLIGTAAGEQAGRHIEPAGDLNGDGADDFLVGAPYHHGGTTGEYSGRAYIVFGGADDGPLNDSSLVINGEGSHAYVGQDIAVIGDVSGDGEVDIAVGSGNADTAGQDSGEIYILYGPFVGDRSILEADVVISGEVTFDYAGNALAAAGDYNADGEPDLMVGAIGNDFGGTTAGAAYLLYGPLTETTEISRADLKLYGTDDNHHTGTHLGTVGDMDGDGRVDLFVGAPYVDHPEIDAGAIYLFSGTSGM